MARQERLPKLKDLTGGWGNLNSAQATVAYSLALAAMELYDQAFRSYGLRNLMKNPTRLPEITDELDRRLPEYLR
jgi:hypothetical protein